MWTWLRKMLLHRIEARNGAAFDGREEFRQDGAAESIELLRERLPVIGLDPGFRGYAGEGRRHETFCPYLT